MTPSASADRSGPTGAVRTQGLSVNPAASAGNCSGHNGTTTVGRDDSALVPADPPLPALVGPARVVDLSDVPPGGGIGRERLGAVAPGERLLLRTDWSRRFGEPAYYEEFPSLAVNTMPP